MIAVGLLVLVPVLMWIGQSALLIAAGQPLRRRLGAEGLPNPLRQANRVITNGSLLAIVSAYPLVRGESPIAYYAKLLPAGRSAWSFVHGAAAAVLYLALLYLAWTITDNVRFRVRSSTGKLARRLAVVPLTAVFGALAEELLFRGMLLADLLNWFPPPLAVAVGAFLFAAAHYLRPVKRYWTFPGHVALGGLLCCAFLWTGSLWLPIGLHAGGILVIMAARPFVRYVGPPWLVGASVFPYAGIMGIAALLLLTLNVWFLYGGRP